MRIRELVQDWAHSPPAPVPTRELRLRLPLRQAMRVAVRGEER